MEQLGIDVKLLLAQVTNFLIFFFVFKKFIAGPFTKYVENEKKKEHEKEKMMKELDEKYQRMQDEEQEWNRKLQSEKDQIIADTKKAAEGVKADIVAEAKHEAEDVLNKAQKQIKEERETLYNDVKRRTVDLSTYIIEKGLNEYLTEDAKRNLTQHIVNNPELRKEIENKQS